MPRKLPSYRQRKGFSQAIVTLTDARTHKRRDYWLGPYGSPQSRELYHRMLAEWEGNGPTLPELESERACPASRITLSEVVLTYWNWARNRRQKPRKQPGDHYTSTSYYRAIQYACEKAFAPRRQRKRYTQPDLQRKYSWTMRQRSRAQTHRPTSAACNAAIAAASISG